MNEIAESLDYLVSAALHVCGDKTGDGAHTAIHYLKLVDPDLADQVENNLRDPAEHKTALRAILGRAHSLILKSKLA
ncbi:MAG: hypothetical protein ACK5SX_15780 [Sandaracinobacter sp.]